MHRQLFLTGIGDEQDALLFRLVGSLTRNSFDQHGDLSENFSVSEHVLLDLSECTDIDSSGVSCLLRLRQLSLSRNKLLVLHSLPKRVQKIFDLLNLDRIICIADDLKSALKEIRDG